MGTVVFFFNDTATTEIYTLSLHDALPISAAEHGISSDRRQARRGMPQNDPPLRRDHGKRIAPPGPFQSRGRSEEHTSELQSRQYLVCRLLLEKKITHVCSLYRSLAHLFQL